MFKKIQKIFDTQIFTLNVEDKIKRKIVVGILLMVITYTTLVMYNPTNLLGTEQFYIIGSIGLVYILYIADQIPYKIRIAMFTAIIIIASLIEQNLR